MIPFKVHGHGSLLHMFHTRPNEMSLFNNQIALEEKQDCLSQILSRSLIFKEGVSGMRALH